MTLTLLIEYPRHPDWGTRRQDIALGEPFYLVGSEGKYTVFVQTEPRTDSGPCHGAACDHVSHRSET